MVSQDTAASRAALEQELAALHQRGLLDETAERLLRGYGPEIYGYLVATLHGDDDADEVFALFAEACWRSLGSYRRASSFRTWAYAVARHAALRFLRGDRRRRKREVFDDSAAGRVAAEVKRTTTKAFLRTEAKERVRALRERLSPEEQELLILRIDRGLEWRDIARVFEGNDATAAELARASATLRKRFERTKAGLRRLLAEGAAGKGPARPKG